MLPDPGGHLSRIEDLLQKEMVMSLELRAASAEVVKAIDQILQSHLALNGYRRVDVVADFDWDGEPILVCNAHYDLRTEPLDLRVLDGILTEIVDAIRALGEERFPHVRHHFHENQLVAEDV
jgi:hypothetical protein